MSYDYILMKGKAGQGLEALVEGALSRTIGTADELKASIGGLFPAVKWHTGSSAPGALPPGWFGRADTAEFQFLVEADGQVRILMMSRCERAEAERVATALGLAAIDEQSMEQFGDL